MSEVGCNYPDREYTYTAAAATASTATTATAGAAATTGGLTAASALGTSILAVVLGLLSSLGLASQLDRHLALKDLLSGELSDGAVGLGGGREVDERVADGALGAGVLGDRNGLAAGMVSNVDVFQTHTQTTGTTVGRSSDAGKTIRIDVKGPLEDGMMCIAEAGGRVATHTSRVYPF